MMRRRVHDSPPVYLISEFLTSAECEALITASDGRLQDAHVVGKGEPGQRNSFGYVQGRTKRLRLFLVRPIKQWKSMSGLLSHAAGKPRSHMELPQVGLYLAGQHYAPHFDAVEPGAPSGRLFLANGGQRIATLLVYLNTPARGGRTSFPSMQLSIVPQAGQALIFFPAFVDGRLDVRALHTAEPAGDTKWVSQIWLRESGDRRDAEPSRRSQPMLSMAPAESGSGSDDGAETEAAVSGGALEALMGGLHTTEQAAAAAAKAARRGRDGPPA